MYKIYFDLYQVQPTLSIKDYNVDNCIEKFDPKGLSVWSVNLC